MGVQESEAVGPDEPHPRASGNVYKLVLQNSTGCVNLTEASGDDHAAANLLGGTLQDCIADCIAGYCDDRDVKRIVQLVERCNYRQVEYPLALGINRDDLPGKSAVQRVVQHPGAELSQIF